MLYNVDGKICIATNSYYKEVEIFKIGKEYNVKVKQGAKKIERRTNDSFPEITLDEAYKKITK